MFREREIGTHWTSEQVKIQLLAVTLGLCILQHCLNETFKCALNLLHFERDRDTLDKRTSQNPITCSYFTTLLKWNIQVCLKFIAYLAARMKSIYADTSIGCCRFDIFEFSDMANLVTKYLRLGTLCHSKMPYILCQRNKMAGLTSA